MVRPATGQENSSKVIRAVSGFSIFVSRFLKFLYIDTDKLYTHNE